MTMNWNLWNGTDSLLQRLIDGGSARLEGTGALEIEGGHCATEASKVSRGPGRVQFTLLCDFEAYRTTEEEAIQVRLQSCDAAAFEIIRGQATQPLEPLPQYQLHGSVSTELGTVPIQMRSIILDSRTIAPIGITEGEKTICRLAPVYNVTVGLLTPESNLSTCKVLVPNFVDDATVESDGIRIRLREISPEATQQLAAPESHGKILPSSYLEVQRLQEDADKNIRTAVDDCGWLLSFYAGRRIQPIAWEGRTEHGTVWRIYDKQMVTPVNGDHTTSCISDTVSLEHFLQYAWEAWVSHGAPQRLRLRGAINSYVDVLSATFSTQKLALTTMYLERFRDLVFGSSTILEEVNRNNSIKIDKIAKAVRKTLRDSIDQQEALTNDEKDQLVEAVKLVRSGHIKGLFRKPFKQALLELYEKVDLEVDPVALGKFISERDKVVHGSWDSGNEGAFQTYRLAEYGLHLLEMLLLRLLGHHGEYINRATASKEYFPFGEID